MSNEIQKVIAGFPATPILFIGSGLSKRYFNLPNWEGLLSIFAKRLSGDEFAYEKYKNRAQEHLSHVGLFPEIASLIQKDFDEKWFSDPSFRQATDKYLQAVHDGTSPFKAEIASYISEHSSIVDQYKDELSLLSSITVKSISGIITTNYDCLLEQIADSYACYIGQEELLFSPIQGIAEIYKIHGCISHPETIVINSSDYIEFAQKSSYLAAKLMTLFMEYPIIFMGYSISDSNIQKILESIVYCLSDSNLFRLKDRLIFIDYDVNCVEPIIQTHSIAFGAKSIHMTKIILSDFSELYHAISKKKNSIPVRILRTFKQEFYDFTISNKPTARLRVAAFDDNNISDNDLALAFGRISDIGLVGLKGMTANDWYRDIIMNDSGFNADDKLTYAYPYIIKRGTSALPLNKYLQEATGEFKDLRQQAAVNNLDTIVSKSILKRRYSLHLNERSVSGIIRQTGSDICKTTLYIAHLEASEIDIGELEQFLKSLFTQNPDILLDNLKGLATNIRRLIRIYDYMKYYTSI